MMSNAAKIFDIL